MLQARGTDELESDGVSTVEVLDVPRELIRETREITVTDYIAECLVACGVTHVFGGHDDTIGPLINSISRHPKLTWIYTRVEVSASLAAAAYAKLQEGLACCVASSGPAAIQLVTGLIDAQLDRCAVLCITGLKNTWAIGHSDFQEVDHTNIFKAAGVSYSQSVMHESTLASLLRDALVFALTQAVCAHLAIPLDVQQSTITVPHGLHFPVDLLKSAAPSEESINVVANYLVHQRASGERILFAIGHRAVGEASKYILRTALAIGVPIVTTQDAKGCVAEDNEHVVGVVGIFGNPGMEASAELIATAGIVVCFGVEEHSQLLVGPDGLQNAQLIEVDRLGFCCSRFKPVHILSGDIRKTCKALSQQLGRKVARQLTCGTLTKIPGKTWKSSILGPISWGMEEETNELGFKAQALHQRSSIYECPESELKKNFCHPGRVMQLLGPKLRENAVITVDVGDCALWVSLCLCLTGNNQRTLASMRMGTMGYSIYGAMAAAALRPEAQVVAIAGDGGVQMALNEFATLAEMQASVVLIIFANNKLGRVHNEIWGPAHVLDQEKPHGCGITNPDFCILAEVYGGKGIRLNNDDPDVVNRALDEALGTKGFVLIEVIQDPEVKPCMHKKEAKRNRSSAVAVGKHLSAPT